MASERLLVQQDVRIEARLETVYGFLTDPELMARWMGIEAELDPRPGGTYRVNVNGRDIARGEFVDLVPHSRVVFTFGWEGEDSAVPPGSSTVEFTLTPDGSGTMVRLAHRDLPEGALDIHAQGWTHYLARLATAAGGGDPGPDPMASPDAMRR
jgi:uncharacterized protein YndB with AHSA1/START domain